MSLRGIGCPSCRKVQLAFLQVPNNQYLQRVPQAKAVSKAAAGQHRAR